MPPLGSILKDGDMQSCLLEVLNMVKGLRYSQASNTKSQDTLSNHTPRRTDLGTLVVLSYEPKAKQPL